MDGWRGARLRDGLDRAGAVLARSRPNRHLYSYLIRPPFTVAAFGFADRSRVTRFVFVDFDFLAMTLLRVPHTVELRCDMIRRRPARVKE